MFTVIPAKREIVRSIRQGFRTEGRASLRKAALPTTPTPGEELMFTSGKEEVRAIVGAYAWNSEVGKFDLVLRPTPLQG